MWIIPEFWQLNKQNQTKNWPAITQSVVFQLKSQVQYLCKFKSQCDKGSFPEPVFTADSLTVSTQPACVVTCINSCAHVKNPKHWQPPYCLDAHKYSTHSREWVALLLDAHKYSTHSREWVALLLDAHKYSTHSREWVALLLDAHKYSTHSREWVALLLQLLCLTQVRWLEIPAREKEALKKEQDSNLK